jgi:DNA-binding transcriptional MerR regulator
MSDDSALFSIGEFSQISGLSIKTLRFYDEKGLLKPAQVDPTTGYRFYDAASAERARVISRLRELQFPVETIGDILADCSDEADLLGYFERQHRSILERLRADRRIAKMLAKVIADEREAAQVAAEEFRIEDKRLEPLLVAGIRIKGRYEESGHAFARLGREMGRYLSGKPLTLYHDGEYRDEDANFEPCFPLREPSSVPSGSSLRTLPAVACLSEIHPGPYPHLGRSYKKVLLEAKRRGTAIALPTREVYLKGPGMIFRGNPRHYLTEIQIPLAS